MDLVVQICFPIILCYSLNNTTNLVIVFYFYFGRLRTRFYLELNEVLAFPPCYRLYLGFLMLS